VVLAVQADGKILVGLQGPTNALHHGIYRFNSDGTLDSTFNAAINGASVTAIVVQPDGKILVCGAFDGMTNGVFTTLARLNPDGSIDASFVRMVHGSLTPPYNGATSIVLQPDRKIVFGSSDITNVGDVLLGRLNPDGTIDGTFHAPICQGSLIALALQSDGKSLRRADLRLTARVIPCRKTLSRVSIPMARAT